MGSRGVHAGKTKTQETPILTARVDLPTWDLSSGRERRNNIEFMDVSCRRALRGRSLRILNRGAPTVLVLLLTSDGIF